MAGAANLRLQGVQKSIKIESNKNNKKQKNRTPDKTEKWDAPGAHGDNLLTLVWRQDSLEGEQFNKTSTLQAQDSLSHDASGLKPGELQISDDYSGTSYSEWGVTILVPDVLLHNSFKKCVWYPEGVLTILVPLIRRGYYSGTKTKQKHKTTTQNNKRQQTKTKKQTQTNKQNTQKQTTKTKQNKTTHNIKQKQNTNKKKTQQQQQQNNNNTNKHKTQQKHKQQKHNKKQHTQNKTTKTKTKQHKTNKTTQNKNTQTKHKQKKKQTKNNTKNRNNKPTHKHKQTKQQKTNKNTTI